MTERITGMSPNRQARLAGGFYLINILTGVFAIIFVRSALLVPGDAAATAANILAHETRFRLGFRSRDCHLHNLHTLGGHLL